MIRPILIAALLTSTALAAPLAHAAAPVPKAAPAPAMSPTAQAELRARLGAAVVSSPGFEWPANRADLDDALARKDWQRLAALMKSISSYGEVIRLLDWEEYQATMGDMMIARLHGNHLWDAAQLVEASARKDANSQDQITRLKQMAIWWDLYVIAVMRVEGVRCADPTSISDHMGRFIQQRRDPLLYARDLPKDELNALISRAVRTEALLAPLREPEVFLCQGGLADLAAVDDKTPMREIPTPPGGIGRTFEMRPDPAKRPPPFIDQAEWPAKEAAARAILTEYLAGFFEAARR